MVVSRDSSLGDRQLILWIVRQMWECRKKIYAQEKGEEPKIRSAREIGITKKELGIIIIKKSQN